MFTLLAILVLTILVLVHEWGHFIAARLQGIHVSNFSIGFGPTLIRYQGEKTEYTLRAIPLGGYVGFPDDDEASAIPATDPNLLRNRPLADRALVISAGVIANFFFAYFLLFVMAMTVGVGTIDQSGIKVVKVLDPNAPAAVAGLRPGDIILQAGNQRYGNDLGVLDDFQHYIAHYSQTAVELTVLRQEQNLHLSVTPQGEPGKGKIGILLDFRGKPHRQAIRNPFTAMQVAAKDFERLVQQTLRGLGQLVTNFQKSAGQVAGPVAIVAMGSEIARSDTASLFDFTAIISINLAVMNLLPLPALDGGQLLFLILEAVRGGKPLPRKLQENVMQGGLAVLLGLGVLMIFKDSFRLFQQLYLTSL